MIDETTDLLIRARGFIERGWCRGTFARDVNGNPVTSTDPSAAGWCMYGALEAAGRGVIDSRAILRLSRETDGVLIDFFNNRQKTVEPVLAAFDRAIAGNPVAAEGRNPLERRNRSAGDAG
jgi:hypothetical protein